MHKTQYFFLYMGLFSFLFGGCDNKTIPEIQKTKETVHMVSPQQISFSQVDITETFGDNTHLKPDEWVSTTPLNKSIPDPEAQGLPSVTADSEEIHKVASKLSTLRESISIPSDGVYCPVCHIANTQLNKLRTPCPKCERPLLKFGWD